MAFGNGWDGSAMRMTTARVLTVLALLALIVAGLNVARGPGNPALDWRVVRLPPPEVTTERPAPRRIVQTITAPGTVEAIEEAQIASQTIGRVVEVAVREGDRVEAGALLVKLDDSDARARLDSMMARRSGLEQAVAQAESDHVKAQRDLANARELAARRATSKTELDDATSAATRARALWERAKFELAECDASIRVTREDLQRTEIRAPIAGEVAALDVEVGEIVIAGTTNLPGTVLMTVADMSRIRVRANVDETDVKWLRPGQPALVYLQTDPGKPIRARVDRVAPKGRKEGEVVMFETLLELTESSGVARAGMTGTVEIEVRESEAAVSVPVQAVSHRKRKDLPDTAEIRAWSERRPKTAGEARRPEAQQYVKVVFVREGGTVRAKPVETGITDERHVEIIWGLEPGDEVVTGPFRSLEQLNDGSEVTPAPGSGSGSDSGSESDSGSTATVASGAGGVSGGE